MARRTGRWVSLLMARHGNRRRKAWSRPTLRSRLRAGGARGRGHEVVPGKAAGTTERRTGRPPCNPASVVLTARTPRGSPFSGIALGVLPARAYDVVGGGAGPPRGIGKGDRAMDEHGKMQA